MGCSTSKTNAQTTVYSKSMAKSAHVTHYTRDGDLLPQSMVQCPACNIIIEKISGSNEMMCGCEARPAGGTLEKAIQGGGCGHEFDFATLEPKGQGAPGAPINERQVNFKNAYIPPVQAQQFQSKPEEIQLPGNMCQCPACGIIIEKISGDDKMMCGCEAKVAGGTYEKALQGGGCGHEFNFKTKEPLGQGKLGAPANDRQVHFKPQIQRKQTFKQPVWQSQPLQDLEAEWQPMPDFIPPVQAPQEANPYPILQQPFLQKLYNIQSKKDDKMLPANMRRCPACDIIIEKISGDNKMMCGCESRAAGGTLEKAIQGGGCGHEFDFETLQSLGQGLPGAPINDRQTNFVKKPIVNQNQNQQDMDFGLPVPEALPPRRISLKRVKTDVNIINTGDPCPICTMDINDEEEKKEAVQIESCKHHPHHNKCLSDWQKRIKKAVKCTICE